MSPCAGIAPPRFCRRNDSHILSGPRKGWPFPPPQVDGPVRENYGVESASVDPVPVTVIENERSFSDRLSDRCPAGGEGRCRRTCVKVWRRHAYVHVIRQRCCVGCFRFLQKLFPDLSVLRTSFPRSCARSKLLSSDKQSSQPVKARTIVSALQQLFARRSARLVYRR